MTYLCLSKFALLACRHKQLTELSCGYKPKGGGEQWHKNIRISAILRLADIRILCKPLTAPER
ncbi:hypothetical protein MASSI9I_60372 [Massilia sp. 9I]|nr:hypothetical protein MASSI9I_60372 [Massilia sp. 9I]